MSSRAAAPSKTDGRDAPAGDGAAERCPAPDRQLKMLERLAEAGLEIALVIERRVKAAEPDQPLAELNAAAVAYARVAPAVRQTLMLKSRLEAEQAAASARAVGLRARVARIVRRAIEDEHGDAERADRLAAEAAERLDQERYGDVLTRPVGEIVADICRDLGLSPDWPELSEAIAAAEAFARGEAADAPAAPHATGPMQVRWLDYDEPSSPARDNSLRCASPRRPCAKLRFPQHDVSVSVLDRHDARVWNAIT
ncbi:MAG TPA: hypothetical protein VGM25_11750 [Caulobacteraceae bacterium]